jgi:putative membrane protein
MALLPLLAPNTWLPRPNTWLHMQRASLPSKATRRTAVVLEIDSDAVRENSMWAVTVATGRVPYGEESRKYRRTVYSHSDWLKHRQSHRLFKNLGSTIFSGVVRGLLSEVATVALIALFVAVFNLYVGRVLGKNALLLTLPALPFTLSSPALGLLLVFRTNASYGRWLEARSAWSRIVSHSRNILRQADMWNTATGAARATEMRALSRSLWAFPRCLCAYLRGEEDDERALRAELTSRLGADSAAPLLQSSPYRPVRALYALSVAMDQLSIDEKRRVEMDKSVVLMGDACEACERIFSSPVPLVYTRHTARFLSAWLLLLPFGMWSAFSSGLMQWALVPAAALVAVFLFGIDELAIQLEEPFSILPLEAMCEGVAAVAEEAGYAC